jgi:hypothetical protein
MNNSRDASAGKSVIQYKAGSSSSTLRTHLLSQHAKEWIQTCDQQGITITALGAEEAVCDYRKCHGGTVPQFRAGKKSQSRRPFTQEGFEDAIIDFIVADDQVRIHLQCDSLFCSF